MSTQLAVPLSQVALLLGISTWSCFLTVKLALLINYCFTFTGVFSESQLPLRTGRTGSQHLHLRLYWGRPAHRRSGPDRISFQQRTLSHPFISFLCASEARRACPGPGSGVADQGVFEKSRFAFDFFPANDLYMDGRSHQGKRGAKAMWTSITGFCAVPLVSPFWASIPSSGPFRFTSRPFSS